MNLLLSYCKSFNKGLKLLAILLVFSPAFVKAQSNSKHLPKSKMKVGVLPINTGNLRTTGTSTCPITGDFALNAQDTSGNAINNHASICQSASPFFVFPGQPTIGGVPGTCISTLYDNLSNALGANGTETVYEGGVPVFTICPTCTGGAIGQPNGQNGQPWIFQLFNLDSSLIHKFTVCGSGAVPSTTLSIVDCWTGNPLPSVPASAVFTGAACDTFSLAGNTNIGLGVYTIAPATGSVALTFFGGGGVEVNPNSLSPGNYTINYTFTPPAGDGCNAVTANFKFKILASPTVTLSGNQNICAGGSTTLTAVTTATTNTTFSWSPAGSLAPATGSVVVASPTVTTLYTVIGTSTGSTCAGVDTIRVTVGSPTFTVNSGPMCLGAPTKLIASNSALTYTWLPVAAITTVSANTDTAYVNPSTTTVYTITASNGSCVSAPYIDTLTVIQTPTIAVLSPTVCAGTTATITATGGTNYTWTPSAGLTISVTGDTVYAITPTVSASYTVMGTGAHGCPSMAVSNVTVSNDLGILSGSPVGSCYGSWLGLYAVGASTYTWTTSNHANLSFVSPTTWSVVAATANVGTYSVYIYGESNSGNFCMGHDTVVVTINPTPTVTAVNPVSNICSGSQVVLTASAVPSGTLSVNYNWTPSTGLNPASTTANTVTASPSVTTSYTVTGVYPVSNGGCSASAYYTVNVTPTPTLTVNSPTVCLGNSATISVNPVAVNTTYTWTSIAGVSTATSIAVNSPIAGTFTAMVMATDTANGLSCASAPVTSTLIVNQVPSLTVSPANSAICLGTNDTLNATGALTYAWSAGAIPTTTTDSAIVSPITSSIFTVTGTDINGCVGTQTASVSVSIPDTFNVTGSTNPLTICAGGTETLTINNTSVLSHPTYTWVAPPNGGLTIISNTVAVATPTATGFGGVTYYAIAINGACLDTHRVRIRVNNPPNLNVTPTPSTVCSGNSVTLNTYPPVGFFGPPNLTYTWTTPNGTTIGNTPADSALVYTPPVYSATNANSYTISVVAQGNNPNNTCTSSVTFTVNVDFAPSASAMPAVSPICEKGTIKLLGSSTGGSPIYNWTGPNGFTALNNQTPSIPNATAADAGTYTLVVTLPGNVCPSITFANVNVVPTPTITVSPSGPVCPNQPGTFNCNSNDPNTTYVWTPSAGVNEVSSNVFTATSPTTTAYSVVGSSAGCTSTPKAVTLTVTSVDANFTPSPQIGNAPLPVVFTNNSVTDPATTFTWNYGNGTTYTTNILADPATAITYSNIGTYTVILTAMNANCFAFDTNIVVVLESYTITIPNVFTPNGDGLNDNYMVKSEGVTAMSMLIYDRWGIEMFDSSTINAPWNGKTKAGKDAPDGTYFYIINATDNRGNSNKYKGDLTLIR